MGALETSVSNLMAKAETGKIKFTLAGIAIDSTSYKAVKDCVDNAKIKVSYDATLGANAAKYRYTHNTLFLGFQPVTGQDKEALVVHECTHAACDIAKKSLLVSNSEAAAYVAQSLYFFYMNEKVLADGKVKPTFKSGILQAAWDVATQARATPSLTNEHIKKLLEEIAKDAAYKDRYTKNDDFDGVE